MHGSKYFWRHLFCVDYPSCTLLSVSRTSWVLNYTLNPLPQALVRGFSVRVAVVLFWGFRKGRTQLLGWGRPCVRPAGLSTSSLNARSCVCGVFKFPKNIFSV